MPDPTGVGGGSPLGPIEQQEAMKIGKGPSGGEVQGAMESKTNTLGNLKRMLIAHFGKKDGTKVYNNFLRQMAMQMINQMQQAAAQAKQAQAQARRQSQQ